MAYNTFRYEYAYLYYSNVYNYNNLIQLDFKLKFQCLMGGYMYFFFRYMSLTIRQAVLNMHFFFVKQAFKPWAGVTSQNWQLSLRKLLTCVGSEFNVYKAAEIA